MAEDTRSFEELVAELEDVVRRMSGTDIGIEEAADLYDKARGLHDAAAARLEAVEARIAELSDGGEAD
ncbi:MAG TPA: exodeoxyribonuclease VII small subunit [Acidimicrobiales bacterium]|nr:exodeoxyribonuclease VII small subunit [Acidimicrobiales bacterium]